MSPRKRARRTRTAQVPPVSAADLAAELKALIAANAAKQAETTPQVVAQGQAPSVETGAQVASPLHAKIDAMIAEIRAALATFKGTTTAQVPVIDPKEAFILTLPADQQAQARVLFGLAPASEGGNGPDLDTTDTAMLGEHLDQRAAILPLLATLNTFPNGRGQTRQILAAIGKRLEKTLTPADREKISTGAIRWENAVMWARNHAINAGLMAPNQPRGVWAITDAGKSFLQSHHVR